MDDILDNIGPIIIGVIYFFGWLFNKKNKADDTTPESLQDGDLEAEKREYKRQPQARNRRQPITEPVAQNPSPIPNLKRQNQQADSQRSRDFSWDQPNDSYETKMEAQLKKIEATKREAAKLLSQSAQKPTQAKGQNNTPQKTRTKSSFGSVRSRLKDPKAARSAFIYSEVLGPPVSLRKGTEVLGLTS